jgi:choloylglycine hydrolase
VAHATLPTDGADAGMLAALHVVNAFDIPRGVVRSHHGDDFTAWSSVADLSSRRYVLRAYDDPTPRILRLSDLGLENGDAIRTAPLPSEPAFQRLEV